MVTGRGLCYAIKKRVDKRIVKNPLPLQKHCQKESQESCFTIKISFTETQVSKKAWLQSDVPDNKSLIGTITKSVHCIITEIKKKYEVNSVPYDKSSQVVD